MTIKKAVLMAGVLGAILSFFTAANAADKEYVVSDMYEGLRNQIFDVKPPEIGLSSTSNQVWGMLIEMGFADGVSTLVAIADGTVSLYGSGGGGMIGFGEYEEPREAGGLLLSLAPKYIEYAKPTNKFPLPKAGNIRFYFLTHDATLTAESSVDDLENNRSPFSALYTEGHNVISQIRIVDDQLKNKIQKIIRAAATGNIIEVEAFLEEAINPDIADETGLTPLMVAAYEGKDDVIRLLIKYKSNIEFKDESGYSALMFASNAGNTTSVKILIEAGADVDFKDNDGSTSLMLASQNGSSDLVRLLLKYGADPKIEGSHGLSAIGFAKQNNHKEIERILLGN